MISTGTVQLVLVVLVQQQRPKSCRSKVARWSFCDNRMWHNVTQSVS